MGDNDHLSIGVRKRKKARVSFKDSSVPLREERIHEKGAGRRLRRPAD